jgi:serine phosphatase RsbU (regulator of sigma subunit)
MADWEGDRQPTGAFAPRALIREEVRDLLARLVELTGTTLELRKQESETLPSSSGAPVLAAGRPTGWKVIAAGKSLHRQQAAQVAAEIIGAQIAAGAHGQRLPEEELHHERRLDFLYEMSQHVGGLLDEQEICSFVVERVAWLLECERASLMLYDPESDTLKIRASIGVPEHIAATTAVKPGERISGKVFESGEDVFIGEGESMPSESLGVRELDNAPSFLSVPLTIPADVGSERQVLGVLNLTRKKGGMFTTSDHKLGAALAAHTAAQVRNCRLIITEQQRREMERELRIAAEIQLSLLPEKPLRVGRLEVAGVSRPSRHVGGDFFDYWERDGRICMIVADAAGHDLGAALVATALRSAVRTESVHRESVSHMMHQINLGILPDLLHSELLITVCYLEIDPENELLTYVSCGHPRPLLLRGADQIWLETSAPVLGIDENVVFEEQTLHLEAGDVLVVYTDGVEEAGAPQMEQFGRERLVGCLNEAAQRVPLGVARHIMEAVVQHVGSSDLRDDVTLMVARFD